MTSDGAPELLALAELHGLSVRVRNCLSSAYQKPEFQIRTVDEYLRSERVGVPKAFLALPAFGLRSARELDQFVRRYAATRDATSGPRQQKLSLGASAEALVAQPVRNQAAAPISDRLLAPSEILTAIAKDQQIRVIVRRYGLNGSGTATLEEIAQGFNVTRERIRQIEAATLKKLRMREHDRLTRYLVCQQAELISRIFRGGLWLSPKRLGSASGLLGGEALLAIEATIGSVTEWLTANAIPYRSGWLKPGLEPSAVDHAIASLKALVARGLIPMPLRSAADILAVSVEDLNAAVTCSSGLRLFSNAICPAVVGARTKRTLALLRAMANSDVGTIWPTAWLLSKCREYEPATRHSYRDVGMVLAEAKHLFVNCFENGWSTTIPLGISSELVATKQDLGPDLDRDNIGASDEDGPDEPNTVRLALVTILRDRGPLTLRETVEAFEKSGNPSMSANSVGPTLYTNDDFARLAPHVYWLANAYTASREDETRLDRLMLTEFQCSIYSQSRWAGETRDLYPSWNPSRELSWACWAEANNHALLLASLLAVVDPSEWPTSKSSIGYWKTKKATVGIYSHEERLSVALDETIPDMPSVLAAALWAKKKGRISWIGVNRTTGCRINDRHAATTLAILTSLGVVTPPNHWQKSHAYRSGAEPWITEMLRQLLLGLREWPSSLLASLGNRASPSRKLGWIEEQALTHLLERMGNAEAQGNGEVATRQEVGSEDHIMALLREQRRVRRLASILGN